MHIHISDAACHDLPSFDELHDLVMRCLEAAGQVVQQRQHLCAIAQVAASEFSQYMGVNQHFALLQQTRQLVDTGTEVVYPHRRINENHGSATRLRGMETR